MSGLSVAQVAPLFGAPLWSIVVANAGRSLVHQSRQFPDTDIHHCWCFASASALIRRLGFGRLDIGIIFMA